MSRIHQLRMISGIIITLILLMGCSSDRNIPEPLPTATKGSVSLALDAKSYSTGQTITVVLSNQSTQTIYFQDHLTNCTVVQLQMQMNGNWQGVNPCTAAIATSWHKLDAGQNLTVKLVASNSRPWLAGVYRTTLTYHAGSKTGLQTTTYSAGFQVA